MGKIIPHTFIHHPVPIGELSRCYSFRQDGVISWQFGGTSLNSTW